MNQDDPQKYVDSWLSNQKTLGEQVDVSVIIPAYNEQWRLPTTLIEVITYFEERACPYEIVVVDDGSKDDTASLVKKFEKIRPGVRLIRVPTNQGKGYAVKTGMVNARGKRLLMADADGSAPIAELEKLEQALNQGADIAIGSRAMFSSDTKVQTDFFHKIRGRVFNWLVNFVLLPGIADTQCGFKLFTLDAAKFLFSHQRSKRYSFDVELLYIALRAGFKTTEVPVNWKNAPGSKVSPILDPLRMLRDLFVFRVWHRKISPKDLL